MKNPKILWVTSFNKQLYKQSGRRMISSFLAQSVPGRLFASYEGFDCRYPGTPQVITYNLSGDKVLNQFTTSHADVIPESLGGVAKQCSCPGADNLKPSNSNHKPKCHWDYWNRNCARWFRKIPTIEAASTVPNVDYLVWVDCDCVFNEISGRFRSEAFVSVAFEGHDGFYLQGRHRKVPECGVFGYNMSRSGAIEHIDVVRNMYLSGEFKMYDRWDDSYIWHRAMMNYDRAFIDAARGVSQKNSHVVQFSAIGDYLKHNKGVHWRKGLGA